ncbi:hypothetical protein B0H15DRAFT_866395 [Mycena belliarum]|uniref:Uncharacterized protein n=1 Tax=Mycena belliarum TaxID=1033014 RepID=A0AAD6XHQ2_9AGAR|nr:hypothetical protein B0H15DRAFT_866395 [Mycena belliae]
MPALPTAMSNTSTPSKRGSKQGQGQGAQLTAHTLAQLQDQNASAEGLVRPRPRPRGTSDASSSRISVAAFREARRAPSPALGVYSPGGPQQHHQEAPYPSQQQQQRAPVPPPKTTPGKHGHGKTAQPQRRAGHARENQWESDDNESESGDERGEQPAGGGTDGGKSPSASKARSELGHGGTSGLGMGIRAQRLSQSQLPPLQTHALVPSLSQSQSSQSQHSHATTYSQPHRPPQPQPPKPQLSSSTSDSISSSEEDSDDAPLATLVAPRRPGSALSLVASSRGSSTNLHASAPGSYTNLANSHSNLAAGHAHSNLAPSPVSATSRGPPKTKPLIDIASLTASRPAVKEQGRSAEGFTGVGMLASLSGSSPSTRNNTSSMAASTTASPVLTSRSPPNLEQRGLVQFPSPPSSPVREVPPAIGGREEKRSPMRKEAGGNVVSLDNPGAPGKRDVLSDRLRAVAAVNLESERQRARTGSPPARMLTASPPARTLSDSPPAIRPGTPPMTRPAPPPTKRSASPPAVVARSPPLRTKPAPPIAARKAFHRRSSSDIISGRPQRMWGQEDDDGGDGALGRDLADMLGGGIALVSRAGESPPSPEKMRPLPPAEEDQDKDRIAPIVIKQRAPPPAFSVTSRPQNRSISSFGDLDVGGRQRSSTLVPISSVPDTFNSGNSSNSNYSSSAAGSEARSFASGTGSSSGVRGNARQRSSTMMPLGSGVVTSSPSSSPPVASPSPPAPAPTPIRPFATPRAAGARPSPASSTGDSSSGPAPLTPKDGSDVDGAAWSGGVSGLVARGGRGPVQRRSVSFDFEEGVRLGTGAEGKGKGKPRETPVQEEERRRERRRSEARAAIELGNVINGRGPIDEDEDGGGGDSDDDVPINRARAGASQMMGTMNMPMNNMPMNAMMGNMGNVGMNMGMSGWQPGMLSPAQFMTPPPADPAFFAAHQQAMMIAKQAYQMAVAQQAMAVAGDEWERGSAYGGAQSEYGGGGGRPSSVYGGAASSVYGGGASSVYGGSAYGGAAGPAPFMGMGGGMGMGMQGGWSPGGGMLFPPAPRSMYGGGGGSGARSDYGGGGGGSGGGWNSSRSVYGESFGPSTDRFAKSGSGGSGGRNLRERAESGYFPPGPGVPQGQGRPGPGQQGPGNPRQRTASQPANPSRNAGANARRPPPPSSWKASP